MRIVMSEEQQLFILAGNGPYENRGCEAILRGTVKILREYFPDPQFLCVSHYHNEQQFRNDCKQEKDKAIRLASSVRMNTKEILRNFWKPGVSAYGFRRLFRPESLKYQIFGEMLPCLDKASAVLSIGGDNYVIEYNCIPSLYTDLDDIVLERGKPLVIWGASVGPFDAMPEYERYMIDHLGKITGIFARESVTVGYLKKHGVTANVRQVADPAFLMDPVRPADTGISDTIDKDAIGINLSPLLALYVTGGDMQRWEQTAADIITAVAKKTSRPIYLIPHVTTPVSNDSVFLRNVWNRLGAEIKPGVKLIPPDYNAAETKWIISQLSLLAGARTHATVAALSSCIPTLSFAYSIKAQGINRDIFGHEDYCLGPDQCTPEIVTARIESMLAANARIKNELREKIPFIQSCARNAGRYLQDLSR
jgi:colanic acid/amylovoran biosynthesis protein